MYTHFPPRLQRDNIISKQESSYKEEDTIINNEIKWDTITIVEQYISSHNVYLS